MFKKLIYLFALSTSSLFAMEEQSKFEFWSKLPEEIKQQIFKNTYNWKFDRDNPQTIIDSYKKYLEARKVKNKAYNASLYEAFKNFLISNLKNKEDISKLSTDILDQPLKLRFDSPKLTQFLSSFIKLLLKLDKFDVNAKDTYFGVAALMRTLPWKDTELPYLLINSGADINEKNFEGETVLMKAVKTGHQDLVNFLIDKGADINAKMNNGTTILMVASDSGHKDLVKLLIDKGFDVNAKNSRDETALLWASKNAHADIIKLLINADADVNAENFEKISPMYWISRHYYWTPEFLNLIKQKEEERKKREQTCSVM